MKFDFQNPVKVVFGPGRLVELGGLVAEIGSRAMVIIGSGSVKQNGTLDKALKSLTDAGIAFEMFEGIEPNPRVSTIRRGIAAVRAFDAQVVVALGGGSVMDAAKVIAAGALMDCDPWDMVRVAGRPTVEPDATIPVITVPTLAATGSEMNCNAVVTNEDTSQKSAVIHPVLYPEVCLIDPELTLTVPAYHTAAGVVDIITHVTEGYFNAAPGTPLQDGLAEAVIATTIKFGARAVADGSDLAAREAVMWSSTVALNGWVHAGWMAPFPCHGIEHVLSAHFDISHGMGLAIVSPAWMRFAVKKAGPGKWAGFARRVMGVVCEDDMKAAVEGIDRLEAFFKSIGAPTRLHEVGISKESIHMLAEDTVRVSGDKGFVASRPGLTAADIEEILMSVA
jgi:alcohol dehydrogenase YqhD (iron-dependent ADH family)